ncbi:MAG: AAA domain-containing protein, partial [Chitinivibrionales bacterium]|nr:AAA domain-containing protein [Chitinivibrionales bacterium]
VASSGRECLRALQATPYEFVFVDTAFLRELGAGEDIRAYRNTLKLFWNIFPSTQIVVLCTQSDIRKAVQAVQAGATNYLAYPLDPKEVRYVVQSTYAAIRMQSELDYLRDQFWQSESAETVRTNSPVMREVFTKVRTVAPADTTVLLTGETGTGKGVVANLIHRHSGRRERQFISVHCGAIPDSLLESELFGHERGAFTGAVRRKLGKFEIAQGGTIFLDEIGTMPLPAQVKLLQVLQDHIFQRIGGEDTITSNVRVIAASNVELKDMAEQGSFRRDLFYRLNVFPIELPPLRQRREDIALLAETFLDRLNSAHGKEISRIHPDVLEAFQAYPWPGNIRELENLMERAYLLEQSQTLSPRGFPPDLFHHAPTVSIASLDITRPLGEVRAEAQARVEKDYLRQQLETHRGKIGDTARASGITPRQLHKLLTRHGIRKEEYRG